jgi:hypothetical protein
LYSKLLFIDYIKLRVKCNIIFVINLTIYSIILIMNNKIMNIIFDKF